MNIGQKLVQGLKRFAKRIERGEPIEVTKVSRRLRQIEHKTTSGLGNVSAGRLLWDEATEDCE